MPSQCFNVCLLYLFVDVQLDKKYNTEDMVHLGELGHGSCGYVIRMEHKPSGEVMAVKVRSSV